MLCVMPTAITLEKFQGPLDLLLQLIEQEKMNISEISLANVTEQFFDYLKTVEDRRPEELADFLVIATRLVYLKSRQLLPYLYPEADEGPSLAEQLKLYQRYAEASKVVERLWRRGLVAYGHIEPVPVRREFAPPLKLGASDLHAAMTLLIGRLKPLRPLPQVTIDHSVSVRQQVEQIFFKLKELKKFHFSDILKSAQNRTEVIVSFLAILELVKQSKAAIQQGKAFEEMEIRRV